MTASCPRCLVALVDTHAAEHRCPGCRGCLLEPEAAEVELARHVGLDRAGLLELASAFGGKRATCPCCAQQMRPLVLRSVSLDLCFGCGALWFDEGELVRFTGDSGRELASEATATVEPRFTLVLSGDLAPPFEPLSAAFLAAGHTTIDARQWVNRSSGVILEKLSRASAEAFCSALGDAASRVALVDDDELQLPPAFDAPRLRVVGDTLEILDHMNHSATTPLSEVLGVVAARVDGTPHKSQLIEKQIVRLRGGAKYRLEHKTTKRTSKAAVLALLTRDRRLRLNSTRIPNVPLAQRAQSLRDLVATLVEREVGVIHPMTRAAIEADQDFPSINSGGDLDRELNWLGWRARMR